ncbi:hypothetical protein AGMMS50276_13280 [Synergistales bacterium]|nr:hypothetical protein AGMMS50276_13280 [Synergistales bacterium]
MDILRDMELHKVIKQMRVSRKLTQVKVADAVGVSTFTLIRWERGERSPDGQFLEKLASVLGYSLILSTDGSWSCYPDEENESLSGTSETLDDIYKKVIEAKDKAVWHVFFKNLVKNNAELESWLRKSGGGEDVDEKSFKRISDVLLALVRSEN